MLINVYQRVLFYGFLGVATMMSEFWIYKNSVFYLQMYRSNTSHTVDQQGTHNFHIMTTALVV